MPVLPAFADACPVCQPGIPDGAPPKTAETVNGGTLTSHECGSCGTRWHTWRDKWGWPIARKLAPVTKKQAERNRTLLAEAVTGTGTAA